MNETKPRAHIQNPTPEQLELMLGELSHASFLHLIEPESGEDDGATNASFIQDTARKLGLPADAPWSDVEPALQGAGYHEIRVSHEDGTNRFYLNEANIDRFRWLDKHL